MGSFEANELSGGMGLGLCAVANILDRFGAKSKTENRLGEGVTFKVTLLLPAA